MDSTSSSASSPSSPSAAPPGYHAVTPYLSLKRAREALDFYKRAFGAVEIYRLDMPGGAIGHAEIRIGDSRIMLSDEFDMPDTVAKSPETVGLPTTTFCLYVADADAAVRRALDAGAVLKKPLEDQFYGDRTGTVADPFGHVWTLATRIEEVTPEEMKKRMAALFS